MNFEDVALIDIFTSEKWQSDKISRIEVKEKLENLKNDLISGDVGINWNVFFSEIMEAGSRFLDIKLKDVLEKAWEKYKEISPYLDAEKYPGDEVFLIPMVEHTIISTHRPKIEIKLGDVHVTDIDFEIVLSLFLSGILLKISHGKIQGLKAGKLKCKGTFSCEGEMIMEKESREFVF